MERIACVLVAVLAVGCGGGTASGIDAAAGNHDAAAGNHDAAQSDATGAQPDAAPLTDLVFCVSETNRYRATVQKPALAHSAQLEAYANTGAMTDTLAMSAHKHFSDTNGGGISFAENECPSFLGWTVMGTVHDTIAACIAAFWSEGPGGGHYENMIGNYGTLGCGVYLNGTGGITITQDYGQ